MNSSPLKESLNRFKREPHLIMPAFIAWLRGWWYKIILPLCMKKFKAGSGFRVYGPLYISGPGKVVLGNNCIIISNAIKPVCIRTFSPKATVSLGDSSGLNGTSIQCVDCVEIDELSNIADAYITDNSAHTISSDRRSKTINDARIGRVKIERNVWVSVQVVILHGVTIGENSVIGACSLVRNDVPSNVFAAGNPLKILKKIDE